MQIRLFKDVVKNQYSVRRVEELVQKIKQGENVLSRKAVVPQMPERFVAARQQLSTLFNTNVQMTCSSKGKGKITIPFASEAELERILSAIDTANK
jgi:ParB family chromosome partitioning protein